MHVLPIHGRLVDLLPSPFVTISTPLHFVSCFRLPGYSGWVHVVRRDLLIFCGADVDGAEVSSLCEVWSFTGDASVCLPTMEVLVGNFLSNHRKRTETGRQGKSMRDDHFQKEWPCLYELMTVTSVGNVERLPASLNVFSEDGMFKAFLNDREFEQSVCMSHRTLLGLFEVFEGGLQAGDLPWRSQGSKKRR